MESKYVLTFSPDLVNHPIIFRVARDFDVLVNILRADISDDGGRLIVDFEGNRENIKEAIDYLKDCRVHVRKLSHFVIQNDDRCTNCGMCVSICPVEAFQIEEKNWKVVFREESCIVCGLCADACPPGAIQIVNTDILDDVR